MSGYSLHDLSEGKAPMRVVVSSTAMFVGGFTAVFVLLGAGATTIGAWLLSERKWFQVGAGWVVISMGLFIAATAVWSPRFLVPFMRERRIRVSPSRLGRAAPTVMGAAFAFGWTPCIGPFLAGAFALAGSSENVNRGMLVLSFYSIGLGIPFLIAALLMARAFSALEWLKRYSTLIMIGSGLVLAIFGLLMVLDQVTELSSFFANLLRSLGLERFTVS